MLHEPVSVWYIRMAGTAWCQDTHHGVFINAKRLDFLQARTSMGGKNNSLETQHQPVHKGGEGGGRKQCESWHLQSVCP